MLEFIKNNIANIIVVIILLVVTGLVIRKLVIDKRNGKSSCGSSCGNCPMNGSCHKQR
ncbi:MAG: FeoB-associated Cys-rich membrane protein [Lachnospiraceae bacterium]|nr:FeoB-associated Cys-rich membrane protein [Lachnospiraceae bacterium]